MASLFLFVGSLSAAQSGDEAWIVPGGGTLSKMNACDLVVTVALGSTLATILLSSDIALAKGLLALALLVGLQLAVTWPSVRSPTASEAHGPGWAPPRAE